MTTHLVPHAQVAKTIGAIAAVLLAFCVWTRVAHSQAGAMPVYVTNAAAGVMPVVVTGLGGQIAANVPTYAALVAFNPNTLGTNSLVCTTGYAASGDGGSACYSWVAGDTTAANGPFIVASTSGASGRWWMNIPADGVHPQVAGAKCNYNLSTQIGTDDTTPLNNLAQYIQHSAYGIGSIVQDINHPSCLVNSGNFTLAQGVKLQGVGQPITATGGNANAFVPFIALNPSYNLVCVPSSKIENLMVIRAGLAQKPTTMEQAFTYLNSTIQDSSIAITTSGTDCTIRDVQVVGFNKGIYSASSARLVVDGFWPDDATGIEITSNSDTSFVNRVHGYNYYGSSVINHLGAYAATVVGTGSAYVTGDVVTVPGGTCATSPALYVTASGGAIIGLSPVTGAGADVGDCTVTPQTWGATGATVYAGGSGGTTGTQTVTVANSTCTTPPQFSVTIAAGAITAVNSVSVAGVCTQTQLLPQSTVTGAGLSGATLLVTQGKNALALSGGSGSGGTATINTVSSGFRPGTCVYVHDKADGLQITGVECEEYQTQVSLSNVWNLKINYAGGEGGLLNIDKQSVGLLTQNCVADVTIQNINTDANYIGMDLLHESAANGGTCPGTVNQSAEVSIIGGHIGFNAGYSLAGVVTGANSYGTFTGMMLGWASSGYAPIVQIGANSGLWRFENIGFDFTIPQYFTQWISVATSAAPPQSDQFGYKFPGSYVRNGDFMIDQLSEGAATNAGGLRVDGWRRASNFGTVLNTQRVTSVPTIAFSNSLKFSTGSASTPTSGQESFLYTRFTDAQLSDLGWGGVNAQPVVMEWWAQASVTGTYNLALQNNGQSYSYPIPFTISVANTWQYFSMVIPGAPGGLAGGWGPNLGTANAYLAIDLGSGSNFVGTANTWASGNYITTSGSVQFSATNGATLYLAGLHLRPGPFAVPYVMPAYLAELQTAQRFYAKSFPAGTAVAQSAGVAGAATLLTPVTTGNVGVQVKFPVTMAITPPTITFYSPSTSTADCYDVTGAANMGAAAALTAGTEGMFVECPLSGSPTGGDQISVHWTADTGE